MLEKLRDVVRTIRRKLGNSPEAKRFRETDKLLSAALDKSVETVKKSEQTAEKNTAESGGVKNSSKSEVLALDGIDWMGNFTSIKEQLKKHADEINALQPVAVVEYAGEVKTELERLIVHEVSKVGGENMKNGGATFAFDEDGVKQVVRHTDSDETRAAALAAPYVAKRGKLISGHKNHENKGTTTLTYAAPAIINGERVNVGAVIQFDKNGRAHAVNVGLQSGGVFKIDMKKAPKGTGSRVNRYGQGTALPTMDAFKGKVSQPEPKVKGKFSYKDYTAREKQEHDKTALEHFGKTYRWSETGYLLLNGEKLDFSGKHDGAPGGYRTVDHRDIKEALGLDYGGEDYSGAMVQFMGEGNIRISPENNGINLSVAPTGAQEQALEDYISRVRGEVIVDLDDLNGNTLESIEYPRGTRASKVLSDIRNYFAEGVIPQVSEVAKYRYSRKDASGLTQEIARIQRDGKELGHSDAEIQAEIRAAVDEAYSGMIDEFGTMDAGENPYREANVPAPHRFT